MLTQRHRRSNHRDKENLALHIPSNIFPAYCKDQKFKPAKPLTHRPKGKENKRSKRSVKQEQFPEFAIKFRNQTFQSNRVNESLTSRQSHAEQFEQSFGRHQFADKETRQEKEEAWQRQVPQQPIKFKNNQIFPQNKKYLVQYGQAIEKIFKGLDVFNRGRISETNINKWIPQSALYFLGGVFQKIRQERLSLFFAEFESLCKPLLFESSEQDVKWFIEQVNGKETHLNISIDTGSEEKQKNSPVQMRVNYQQETSKKKSQRSSNHQQSGSKAKEPIQFNEIISNINNKEKQLNIRLNQMKEKHQASKIQPKSQVNQFSFFNPHNPAIKDPIDFKQISIPSSNKKIGSAKKDQQRLLDTLVPSFSFKLQQSSRPNSCLQDNFLSQKPQKAFEHQQKAYAPRTSRIVRQSLPKSMQNSSKRSSVDPHQSDRIDKLSSRLQQYIKFNNEKIEQNKKFIRQNSLPRK